MPKQNSPNKARWFLMPREIVEMGHKSRAGVVAILLVGFSTALLGQTKQCQSWVENSKELRQCFSFESWVLDYHCDSADCRDAKRKFRLKEFHAKQDAIDWIELNYRFAPATLMHHGEYLSCMYSYINPESEDPDTRVQKTVDCDTEENLDKKYCPDGCITIG